MIYAKRVQWQEALEALRHGARSSTRTWRLTYNYRAKTLLPAERTRARRWRITSSALALDPDARRRARGTHARASRCCAAGWPLTADRRQRAVPDSRRRRRHRDLSARAARRAGRDRSRRTEYFVFTNRETGAGPGARTAPNFTTVPQARARRHRVPRASCGSRPRCRWRRRGCGST